MRKIRKGDTVQVMKGKDAGKQSEVVAVIVDKTGVRNDRVVVKGANIIKRAQKPNPQLGIAGGIVEYEKPLDISNVRFVEGGKPVKIGFKVDEKTGKKVRISKKSGKEI